MSSNEIVKNRSQRTKEKRKKEDIWTCPICWENEKNWNYPLSLGCGHSVCQFCLLKLTIKQSLACPECRAVISHFNANYPLGHMLGLEYKDKYNDINTIYLEDPSLAQLDEEARKKEAEFHQDHIEAEHRDVIGVVEQILRQEGDNISASETGNITVGSRSNGGLLFRANIQGLRLQNVYRNPTGIRMNRWLMVGICFIAFMIIFSVWYFWPGAVMTFFYILFLIYLCYIYMCNRNN